MRRLLIIMVAACGGSSTHAPPAPPAPATPMLLGRPIWDGPLTDDTANRVLGRVRTSLADAPPTLSGKDPKVWTVPLRDWIDRRGQLGREIGIDVEALMGRPDPRMQLLATVALGVVGDDLVTRMIAIPLPAEVRNGEFGADIEKMIRDSLEESAAPLAAAARSALDKCTEVAPLTPAAMRGWEAYCRERASKLGELEARVAGNASSQPPPRKRPPEKPALFADCESKEVLHGPPNALPPDRKVKPAVAFIYDGADVQGADVARLEAAVAAKLRGSVGMPVVDAKELAAARNLVAQRKLHAKGPACGQAPPLTAVVAHKRKHLVLGEITTTCLYSGNDKPHCGLMVNFLRAGVELDNADLPTSMFAPVARRDVPAADYIAAAAALVPLGGRAGILGGLMGSETSPVWTEFSGIADEDPWLRVAWTLREQTTANLATCTDGAGSFDATFTITPNGKTGEVALAPVTAPAAGTKVAVCVKQALEATPWPCTRDGKPAKVSVRVCVAPRP